MLVSLSVPDDNIRNPLSTKQLLDIIHRADVRRRPFSLSVARCGHAVGLFCRYPPELKSLAPGLAAY